MKCRLAPVLAVALITAPALAQKKKPSKAPEPAAAAAPAPPQTPPLSEALTGEAKAAYEAGKLLYGDGDYAGARVKFQAAFDASQDPRLLWNMAICEKGLRHYAKVVSLTQQYLKAGESMLSEADRTEATDLLAAIESFTVELTITVNEPGAEILVDGERVGSSPLDKPFMVDIGSRQISVQKPGFKPYRSTIPGGGQKQASLEIKLERELHQGVLSVTAPKNGTIYIDGQKVGVGGWSGTLSSGGHTLRVLAEGMRPYQSEVVVQDDEKRGVDVVLEPMAATAPAEEKHGPLYDMEVGFRTGYGVSRNLAQGINQNDYEEKSVGFIPLWLDIGYRLGRPTYLGLYGQFGWLDKSETCGIARHGPDPYDAADGAIRYGYTSCKMAKVGVNLAFHLLPRTIVDPYFGFDLAVRASFNSWVSYDPTTGQEYEGNDDNAAFQPGIQLGADLHPAAGLGTGLFVLFGPSIGGEGTPHDNQNQMVDCGNMPQNPACQNQSNDGGAKVGTHTFFGARVAYTFQ